MPGSTPGGRVESGDEYVTETRVGGGDYVIWSLAEHCPEARGEHRGACRFLVGEYAVGGYFGRFAAALLDDDAQDFASFPPDYGFYGAGDGAGDFQPFVEFAMEYRLPGFHRLSFFQFHLGDKAGEVIGDDCHRGASTFRWACAVGYAAGELDVEAFLNFDSDAH